MTDAEVVALVRRHVESQFPKACGSCGRRFQSLLEYLRTTKHVGQPVSYDDAETGDALPSAPIGTFALANCPCGSTLSIGSDGLPVWTIWKLMRWARARRRRQGVTLSTVLEQLRDEIDRQVLAEASAGETGAR